MSRLADGLAPLTNLIGQGRLYPSVVLHGGTREQRVESAVYLARTILCTAAPEQRPCGECVDCRRISAVDDEGFHPDFHLLARDRATVTSAAAVRQWVAEAALAPFEGRAKVFVMLEAETLGPDAADVLLKVLEEPPGQAARHFLLLTANDRELPPTIRSRSMSFYLGASADAGDLESVVERLEGALVGGRAETCARVSQVLLALDDWKDPRSATGWQAAASALMVLAERRQRSWPLDLAADLLLGRGWRIRGVPAARIIEGSVASHLPRAVENGVN